MPDQPRAEGVEPGWPHGPWATPADLRRRPDAANIECQGVVSGRWWPLTHRRWDSCVIEVPWRIAAMSVLSCDYETTASATLGPVMNGEP